MSAIWRVFNSTDSFELNFRHPKVLRKAYDHCIKQAIGPIRNNYWGTKGYKRSGRRTDRGSFFVVFAKISVKLYRIKFKKFLELLKFRKKHQFCINFYSRSTHRLHMVLILIKFNDLPQTFSAFSGPFFPYL